MLLAIDTASGGLSLALHSGRALLAEQTFHQSQAAELAPAALALLNRCGVSADHLAALAVSTGPGVYTELRAGLAFAKGLAAGRGLPLVGLSALDITAAAQPYAQGALIVVVTIGRGRLAVGRYQWRKGRWGARGEPQLMDWDALVASIDGAAQLTGDIDEAAAFADKPVTLVPPAYRLRRAGFLAEEAWARLRSDKADFPASKVQAIDLQTS